FLLPYLYGSFVVRYQEGAVSFADRKMAPHSDCHLISNAELTKLQHLGENSILRHLASMNNMRKVAVTVIFTVVRHVEAHIIPFLFADVRYGDLEIVPKFK